MATSMSYAQLKRLYCHVLAIIAAGSAWYLVSDFAAALASSIIVFLIITGLANRQYGPLAGPEDIQREIQEMLRERGP